MAREEGAASQPEEGASTADAPTWSDLSDELRAVLSWASAAEQYDVGTRAMLIGMLRASESSDLGQLLTAAGCDPSTLLDTLIRVAPRPRIDPFVRQPRSMKGMPPLSPNGRRALEGATVLRNWIDPLAPVTSSHVLGAILELKQSTGYRGLARVLVDYAPMELIREVHAAYLRAPHEMPFDRRLTLAVGGSALLDEPDQRLAPGDVVRTIAFSPDGRELATAGGTKVRLWDVESGAELPGPDASPNQSAIAYAPDASGLALGGSDGEIAIWHRDSGQLTRPPMPSRPDNAVTAMAFLADGALAFTSTEGTVALWRRYQDSTKRRRPLPNVPLRALAISPAGDALAYAGDAGVIWVIDPQSFEIVDERTVGTVAILDLAFAPDGSRVALASGDGATAIWDRADDTVTLLPNRHVGAANAVAFAPDGSLVVSGGADGAIRINNPETGEIDTLERHTAAVHAVAFSPIDPELIATAGADGLILMRGLSMPGDQLEDKVEWLADGPARTDELGRQGLATALAKRLDRAAKAQGDDDSFLIHIDGPWGTGKSSVLRFLEQQLDEASWTVVEFDAWRQSRVGPPWWALLTSLRRKLRDDRSWRQRAWLRISEAWQRLARDGASYLLSLAIVGVAVLAFVLADPTATALGQVAKTFSAVIAAATTLWVGGRIVGRFLMWDSATAARLYEQSHQDPMESLAEHFAWLLSRTDTRVIFFIDDLDRCDADYVVDLLDSIQTLVRDAPQRSAHAGATAKQPYFVVAADGRWIRQSYERRHESFGEAVGEPGRSMGYLFLDKIFQLTVRIPAIGPDRRDAFLRGLLVADGAATDAGPDRGAAAVEELQRSKALIEESQDQAAVLRVLNAAPEEIRADLSDAALDKLSEEAIAQATEHELQRFAPLLEPNPRSMKRFVNTYSMALSTLVLEGRQIDVDPLARWTILCLRWPDLADHLRTVPDEVSLLTGGNGKLSVEKLHPLAARADVQRVACFDGENLTAQAISRLCGSDDSGESA